MFQKFWQMYGIENSHCAVSRRSGKPSSRLLNKMQIFSEKQIVLS
jgi:hypothetical protein